MRGSALWIGVLALGVSLAACGGPERTCPVPAAGGGLPGDASGDGVVDINDPVSLNRHFFQRGPAPACPLAVDVVSGVLEAGDAFALLGHIVSGSSALPAEDDYTCDQVAPAEEAPCGKVGWSWSVDDRIEGTPGGAVSLTATLGIQNGDLEDGPAAWSASVVADACTIEAVDFTDTVADLVGTPAGRIAEGFAHAELIDGGAITAVVLDWIGGGALEPADEAWPVLTVSVSATLPRDGCTPCTLALSDDLSGDGQPIVSAISAAGGSYRPALAETTIQLCAN